MTKKNVEKLVNEFENQLREILSPFIRYELSRDDMREYVQFNVFSTDVAPFITSTVINTVIKVFENSTIDKECMFYGIESCIVPKTEREVPCISITVKIG